MLAAKLLLLYLKSLKESPNEWVFEDGCVTPLLVLNLKNQGELSEKAFSRYFDSLNEVTN